MRKGFSLPSVFPFLPFWSSTMIQVVPHSIKLHAKAAPPAIPIDMLRMLFVEGSSVGGFSELKEDVGSTLMLPLLRLLLLELKIVFMETLGPLPEVNGYTVLLPDDTGEVRPLDSVGLGVAECNVLVSDNMGEVRPLKSVGLGVAECNALVFDNMGEAVRPLESVGVTEYTMLLDDIAEESIPFEFGPSMFCCGP